MRGRYNKLNLIKLRCLLVMDRNTNPVSAYFIRNAFNHVRTGENYYMRALLALKEEGIIDGDAGHGNGFYIINDNWKELMIRELPGEIIELIYLYVDGKIPLSARDIEDLEHNG